MAPAIFFAWNFSHFYESGSATDRHVMTTNVEPEDVF
jgi:hypothetical protein